MGELPPGGEECGLHVIEGMEESIPADVQSKPSPEAPNRIEFGGVWREEDNGDSFWDYEVLCLVPSRPIHDEEEGKAVRR
jgi:hypothetical protein